MMKLLQIFLLIVIHIPTTSFGFIDVPGDDVIPNFVGLALGRTPEWSGASNDITGVVPGARLHLDKGQFVEWYGPYFGANLVRSPNWEAGPVANIRLGRSDVENSTVDQLPEITAGLEAGGYVGYHYMKTEGIPLRLRLGLMVSTHVAGGTSGTNVVPYLSLWMPLSTKVFIGIGAGLSWADEQFMQQFFGVDQGASVASGLPQYSAEAGVRQYYLWPAALFGISEHWMLGVGGYFQKLTGDAEESPIIKQEGQSTQWTYGLGLGYIW